MTTVTVWVLVMSVASGYGISISQLETTTRLQCEQLKSQIAQMPHINKSEMLCVEVTRVTK